MKEIKLDSLTLRHFRCHEFLHLDFGGRDRVIYGDNASGKTSIYDALTWLLFGKDCQGGSGLEVKPLGKDGEVTDPMAITEVQGVLTVDGEQRSFRRTYHQIVSGRDGSFQGNTSEFYVDGVPCRKSEFQKKVSELVEEDCFRLLTGIFRFAGELSWQKRREILFGLSGIQDETTLLTLEPRFAALNEGRGRLSLSDYEKKLKLERRELVTARDHIPVRISEQERVLESLGHPDFEALETLHAALLEEQRSLFSGKDPMEGERSQLQKLRQEDQQLRSENRYMEDRILRE